MQERGDAMRIEKINDRQIRCTLNQKDLQDREIGISELAYGTAKAKALFRDMMQQASYEFGFDADDIPLMIEAIPLLPEALILIVTKIEEPDELDTRFSSFTENPDWDDFDEDFDYDDYDMFDFDEDGDIILDDKPEEEVLWSSMENEPDVYANSDFISLPEVLGMEPKKKQTAENTAPDHDVVFIFAFSDLDTVSQAAELLTPIYRGENTLYKDTKDGTFYLLLSRRGHTADNFGKICNLLHEYGSVVKKQASTISYFEEHYKLIIEKNALKQLAAL